MRSILHCDMNHFYASVACVEDPSLRGRPVAVCGSVEERHGIVLAKSPEAKAFGVSTGEAVWQAKQKCPSLVVVPPHFEAYQYYSARAREIYEQYTDQVEPFGLDECWLDVTGSKSLFGDGECIAHTIRKRIFRDLGLTVSVGVSFNKIFAKLGSDLKKPDAVTAIPKQKFREQIFHLPAGSLLGVGGATEKRLGRYGVHTIGQLAATPPELLRDWFGKCGIKLWEAANGFDVSPVCCGGGVACDKSVGRGVTTPKDLTSDEEVFRVMLALSQEVGHELFCHGKEAYGVAIAIRDCRLVTVQRQKMLPLATQSPHVIAKECFSLFRTAYSFSQPIRSVSIRAISLGEKGAPTQLDLFTDTEAILQRERLDRAVEEIRERYGKGSICNASLLGLTGDGFEPHPVFTHG